MKGQTWISVCFANSLLCTLLPLSTKKTTSSFSCFHWLYSLISRQYLEIIYFSFDIFVLLLFSILVSLGQSLTLYLGWLGTHWSSLVLN